MKSTTTFYDFIKHEWLNAGNSEFIQKDAMQIALNDEHYQVMGLVLNRDEKMMQLVSSKILHVEYNKSTKLFLDSFITQNINKQPKYQTQELFASYFVSLWNVYSPIITNLYDESLLKGKKENQNHGTSIGNSQTHATFNDLPQNNVENSLDVVDYDYATNQTLTKSKNDGNTTNTTLSTQFNLENYGKYVIMVDETLKTFTKILFKNVSIL